MNPMAYSNATIKIIDFGLAIEIGDNEYTDEIVGTVGFMPPEIVQQYSLNSDSTNTSLKRNRSGLVCKKGDMWSIGVITFALLTGTFPYKTEDMFKINWPDPTKIKLSPPCINFIAKLLGWKHETRYTATEALQDPWISHADDNASREDLGPVHKENIGKFDDGM